VKDDLVCIRPSAGGNPTWASRAACIRSLREFSPALRAAHRVVWFWSTRYGTWRYCRVLDTVPCRKQKSKPGT